MIEIELPGLLPRKKAKTNHEFLLDPLYFLLDDFTRKHQIKRLYNAVICFVHEYAEDIPFNRRHDYDNLETKQVLDVVATFLLIDDTSMCCDTYNTAESGNQNGTRILVMPKERFPAWIAEKQVR